MMRPVKKSLVTRLTCLCFVLAAAASVLLYNTSYQVQDLRASLRALDADIVAEQNAMRVLQAEWAYLAEPARIERLAATHLGLNKIASNKEGVRVLTAHNFDRATKPATTTTAPVKLADATKTKTASAQPIKAQRLTQPSTAAQSVTPQNATPQSVGVLLASFRQ